MAEKTHIMRFAPQDWRTSRVRARSARTGDRDLRLVYLELLFALHEAGGTLSDDVALLEDDLMLPADVIAPAVEKLVGMGKLKREGGRLSNPRVVEDLAVEMQFRAEQAERGARGGRARVAAVRQANAKQTLGEGSAGRLSPPSPAPAPIPTPAPAPSPAEPPRADCPGFSASREADLDAPAPDDVRRELLKLAAEGAASPWGGGKDGQELIQEASIVGDSCIDNVYSPHLKRAWIEATISKLRQKRAVWAAKNRIGTPNPAEAWIEANGGRDELARECAEACGWTDNAGPRAAWREKRGAPDGVAALLHWPISRAIEAHRKQATA